ncbi:MAG: transcription termination/antitermination protein NusA [Anaerolineales bacterium]|nr:transcription termination/antitermination protein NusA [Anaerolineales bacterium]
MKKDFALAFKQILEDRGLPQEVVLAAIEDAMVSAYRRAVHASNAQHVEARLDSETGEFEIFVEKEVVEEVQDDRTEVVLKIAKSVDEEADLGDMVIVENTPQDFGRVAAQTARQVIQQRIREAERDAQLKYYANQVGDVVNGIVQAINAKQITLGLDLKAEGVMPRRQQIPREFFRVHDRVRALLMEVQESNRGPKIILSRAHPDFLRRLLENEVPEIYHGMVEIRSISREPGQRSKVAVAALQPGVDPVGACVGIRGVRIQAIVRELNDEKIDVIEWNPDPQSYIAKALSPARVLNVFLEDRGGAKTATVVVPEDQLSLAIGRDGQNARLTAKLTGWRIDIKSLIEATSEVLFKLKNNADYAGYFEQEKDNIPQIEAYMRKKAEGRPITPEDFHDMQAFTERVELGRITSERVEQKEVSERTAQAQEGIPQGAYDLPLDTLGLATRTKNLLVENLKVETVGDLAFKLNYDVEEISGITGIGPKAMEQIESSIDLMISSLPEPEEIIEEEPVVDETDEVEVVAEIPAEKPETVEPSLEDEPAKVKSTEPGVAEAVIEEPAVAEEAPEPVAAEEIAAEIIKPVVEDEVAAEPAAESEQVESEQAEEIPASTEEIIKLQTELIDDPEISKEDELLDDDDKSKKRKKYVEIEYDPDRDVTIYRKKHKKDSKGWDDWDDDEWDV